MDLTITVIGGWRKLQNEELCNFYSSNEKGWDGWGM
jgi:hypothetical protein